MTDTTTKQTEAQRLAVLLQQRKILNIGQGSPLDDAAALLLRQDALLKDAQKAISWMTQMTDEGVFVYGGCLQNARSVEAAIRAHREAQ